MSTIHSQSPHTQQRPVSDPQPQPDHNETADEHEEEFEENQNRFLFFQVMPSWLSSFILHIVLIILLALWYLPVREKENIEVAVGPPAETAGKQLDLEIEPMKLDFDPLESQVSDPTELVEDLEMDMAPIDNAKIFEAPKITVNNFGNESINFGNELKSNGGVSGRNKANRAAMLRKYGGNPSTENAVALALKWIAAHQLPDGGWNFDHRQGPGAHRTSPDPGRNTRARNAATALALLPFLGSGQTHQDGEYKEVVEKGLAYLIKNQRPEGNAGSFFEPEGTMYSHGLAAICLCEAYVMTKDPRLKYPAQKALDYIDFAQDPVGGGWRYAPKMPGDTSVVGWQIMAAKSGVMGELNVHSRVFKRAIKFLDSVSEESGSYYGYQTAGKYRGTTAVGLLCRMYLGWKREHPALERGVAFLAKVGPSAVKERNSYTANMYYNYYATQVMRHYGGDEWKKWNEVMRDFLVDSQDQKGNAKGSWYFKGDHGSDNGGRLYCTALSAMTLEVYYRHMPLYKDDSMEDIYDFD